MEIGIRALRDGLSQHLADVKRGQTITITDHGKVIARIVPAGEPTTMDRLIAEGRVQPARRRKRPSVDPIKTACGVSDLVTDQRR